MSKKINTKKTIDATAESTIPAFDLRAAMESHPNVSLRKLAVACELSYGWILKKSKEPIPNTVYDPTAVNYEAVAAVFAKKGIDLSTLDWESLNEATLKRGVQLTKNMDAFQVGQKVYLREDNTTPFEICYKTDTHIVIMKEGTTEPRAWSHATFLMKGPVFEPRAVSDVAEQEETSEEA